MAGFFTAFLVTSLGGVAGGGPEAVVGVVWMEDQVGRTVDTCMVGTNMSCRLAWSAECEGVGNGSTVKFEREEVMFCNLEQRFREGAVSGTCGGG